MEIIRVVLKLVAIFFMAMVIDRISQALGLDQGDRTVVSVCSIVSMIIFSFA